MTRERFMMAWKVLFVAAGLWSLVAGARIALAPGMVQQVTASGQVGVDGEVETQHEVTTEQVSWYEMQGAWGIVILLIFAGLYGGAAALAVREWLLPALLLAAVAVLLTILSGFSVGFVYLPSLYAVVLGFILLASSRLIGEGA